jgi:hypothetical protein
MVPVPVSSLMPAYFWVLAFAQLGEQLVAAELLLKVNCFA